MTEERQKKEGRPKPPNSYPLTIKPITHVKYIITPTNIGSAIIPPMKHIQSFLSMFTIRSSILFS